MGFKQNENTSNNLHNTLSKGTIITGNISSETDFRLDGEVIGDIACKGKIVMGQHSSVKGNINCINAEILGNITGNIQVSEKLILKTGALINGDICANILVIEPEAQFNGSCQMKNEEKA